MSVFLPLGQDDGSENGDENQEGSEFEGVHEIGKEHVGEDSGGGEFSMRRGGGKIAGGAHDGGGDEAAHGESERNTSEGGEFRKIGAFFLACIQKHDDEDEENHDGAAIHDDLDGGDELGAEKQVQASESHHHNDERESAVNRMTLKNQADRAENGQRGENEENEESTGHTRILQRSTALVSTTLAMETGSKNFQPKLMSWS